VIIALGFCIAIMISIPTGITANQARTDILTQNFSNTITQTEATINQTLKQIDCTLAPRFEGFGFAPRDMTDFRDSEFVPGQFGDGQIPGRFGGGPFGSGGTTAMNETLYDDISSIEGVAAVVPSLQVSEGTEQTMEMFGRSFTRLFQTT